MLPLAIVGAGALLPIVFVLLFVGLAIFLSILAKRREEERTRALMALAESLGLRYELLPIRQETGFFGNTIGDGPFSKLEERFHWLEPFGEGHSRLARHFMHGMVDGIDITVFEYEYKVTTSNGKSTSTTTHPYLVVAARVPFLFPEMGLEEEGLGHRFSKMVGFREMQTEFEEFNRRFYIRAHDPERALAILHPQAMETLLLTSSELEWQFHAFQAVAFMKGSASPDQFYRAILDVVRVVQTVPEYYRQDHGFEARFDSPL